MGIDLIKDMAEAVKATARQQERTSPYDTSAEVRRIEGGTAWVHIPGGVDETPVKLTIACKPGDTVQVRVGGGSAWLVGNASAPPTDDTRANEIYELLKKTRKGLKEVIKNEVDEMIDDGEVGKGILKVVIEHCLANARNIPIGGTFEDIQYSAWQELLPAFVAGKFYWARIVTYYADGTVEYGPPYFDMGAQVTAEVNIAVQEAQDTADEAERIAQEAAQTAGASRKVFNTTPVPPYGVNDMWFDGPHGITYLCSTAKAEGESFAQSDWTEYSTDVSSHFWTDSSGAHIAENQGDVTTGASQTISSTGTVMMRDGKVITSWTGTGPTSAAINFYDCSSASERVGDLIASYGRAGITHYINNIVCQALTASGLSFFSPDSNHWTESIFGPSGVQLYALGVLAMALSSGSTKFYDDDGVTELAEFGRTSAQIGKDGATHTTINSGGVEIFGGDGTEQLAHIGYGYGEDASGASVLAPFFTLGKRSSSVVGNYSMVEGYNNSVKGFCGHAEGNGTSAEAPYSHAEGLNTRVTANSAHAGGIGNTANGEAQTVIGKYATIPESANDLFVIGNGTDASHRSNALRIRKDGRAIFGGAIETGLTWNSRNTMVTAMTGLPTLRPYMFWAEKTTSNGTDKYWSETVGANTGYAYGIIFKLTTTSWHMLFMTTGDGGKLYKSVFTWAGSGTDGSFNTQEIPAAAAASTAQANTTTSIA